MTNKQIRISNLGTRNVGLDILRIIAMLMVVLLHTLVFTGGLCSNIYSTQYLVSWCLNSLSYVAVNWFILISGYFMVDKDFTDKKIFLLWIQIICYTVIGYVLLILIGIADFSVYDLLKCIFPLLSRAYGFLSSYICMLLISPYLNIVIKKLNSKELLKVTGILIILLSILPTFFFWTGWKEPINGTGTVWYICLYFVASCYKRCHIPNINKYWYLFVYLFLSMFNVSTLYIIRFISNILELSTDYAEHFFQYISTTVFIASVSLFLFFMNVGLKEGNLSCFINKISGLTLGVYLWHMRPVLKNLYQSLFHTELLAQQKYYFIYCLFIVIAVFIIGIAAEYLRKIAIDKI